MIGRVDNHDLDLVLADHLREVFELIVDGELRELKRHEDILERNASLFRHPSEDILRDGPRPSPANEERRTPRGNSKPRISEERRSGPKRKREVLGDSRFAMLGRARDDGREIRDQEFVDEIFLMEFLGHEIGRAINARRVSPLPVSVLSGETLERRDRRDVRIGPVEARPFPLKFGPFKSGSLDVLAAPFDPDIEQIVRNALEGHSDQEPLMIIRSAISREVREQSDRPIAGPLIDVIDLVEIPRLSGSVMSD